MENNKEKYEKMKKEINENYIKAESILKEYFKISYENAGREWTEKNNEEINFVMESIKKMAFLWSAEVLEAYNNELIKK